jgi:hypothetical protein
VKSLEILLTIKLNENNKNFSKKELSNDNFLKDIETFVLDCRKKATIIGNLSINNSLFFYCTRDSITLIKGNYSYLD